MFTQTFTLKLTRAGIMLWLSRILTIFIATTCCLSNSAQACHFKRSLTDIDNTRFSYCDKTIEIINKDNKKILTLNFNFSVDQIFFSRHRTAILVRSGERIGLLNNNKVYFFSTISNLKKIRQTSNGTDLVQLSFKEGDRIFRAGAGGLTVALFETKDHITDFNIINESTVISLINNRHIYKTYIDNKNIISSPLFEVEDSVAVLPMNGEKIILIHADPKNGYSICDLSTEYCKPSSGQVKEERSFADGSVIAITD